MFKFIKKLFSDSQTNSDKQEPAAAKQYDDPDAFQLIHKDGKSEYYFKGVKLPDPEDPRWSYKEFDLKLSLGPIKIFSWSTTSSSPPLNMYISGVNVSDNDTIPPLYPVAVWKAQKERQKREKREMQQMDLQSGLEELKILTS